MSITVDTCEAHNPKPRSFNARKGMNGQLPSVGDSEEEQEHPLSIHFDYQVILEVACLQEEAGS